jgi:hypothetical protein
MSFFHDGVATVEGLEAEEVATVEGWVVIRHPACLFDDGGILHLR